LGEFYFQPDSLQNLSEQFVQEDDSTLTDTIEKPDTVKITTNTRPEIHTPVKPIKSLDRVDSLFMELERKEAEVKKFRQEETHVKIQEKKLQEPVTLPPELINCKYADIGWSLIDYSKINGFRAKDGRIFKNHYSQFYNEENIIKKTYNKSVYSPDLIFVVIISLMTGIILIKTLFSRYFINYFQVAFNYQLTNKLLRDRNFFLTRFNFILNIVYIIILSVFIYQALYFFDIKINPDKSQFVYIITIIMGIELGRYIIEKTVGEIFNVQKEFSEYLFNQFLFNKLLGLVLIPLVFIIQYVPENLRTFFIVIGLLLITGSYLIKLIRGFTIIVKKDILIFYVLLYLCTLEILPVLVGYTYFKRLI